MNVRGADGEAAPIAAASEAHRNRWNPWTLGHLLPSHGITFR